MRKRTKTPIEQQVLSERSTIEIRSMETIQKEIDSDKEMAEKDIIKFCRDKAIELLHGCRIYNNRLRVTGEQYPILDILKFLATLGAVN